jgi:hypothetical protein
MHVGRSLMHSDLRRAKPRAAGSECTASARVAANPLAPSEAPRFSVPYRAGRRCLSLKIRPRCPHFYSWRWAAHCKVAAHPGVGGPQLTNSTPVGDPLRGRRMLGPVRPRVAHDAVTLPNLRGRQSKWCLPSGARGRAWRGSARCRSPRRRPSPSVQFCTDFVGGTDRE